MTAIRGLVEVVLVVEDIDRSVAFYRDTLGLEPISPPSLPVKFLRIGSANGGLPQQVVSTNAEFPMQRLTLFESRLSPRGPPYIHVFDFALGS